jgi:ornithine cyclodeaminase/alanine dehydrogenase-like protein (mu-crystallin family)
VFEGGKQLLNIEFDKYVSMRTAAMNAVVLNALNITDLSDKKVLIFGSGKIATETVKILASVFLLKEIDVISKTGNLAEITKAVKNISIQIGNIDDISKYDLIICHTKTDKPVISESHIQKIKHGAILTSFISSTEHGEFPDSIFNDKRANIITDWCQTILGAKDLQRAKEAGLFVDSMYLKDLLSGKTIDTSKQYTIYRSTGTPIQNLAVLKVLLAETL